MLKWSQCPDVESIPGKMSGAWVFKDTRLPIATLFDNLAHGATIKQFVEWYPGVSEQRIIAVLNFVTDHSHYPEDHPILAAV